MSGFNYTRVKRGFSLLELSIVLIIAGLIVGGIIYGQDLIDSARARTIITQIQDLTTATHVFERKYGKMPGDYDEASIILDGSALDGDGNDFIGTARGVTTTFPPSLGEVIAGETNELTGFFHHLSLANMLDSNYDGTQASVIYGGNIPKIDTGYQSTGYIFYNNPLDGFREVFIGIANNTANDSLNTQASLTSQQGFYIDSKLDDGFPLRGNITAQILNPGGTTYLIVSPIPPNNECFITSTNIEIYEVGQLNTFCHLKIKID